MRIYDRTCLHRYFQTSAFKMFWWNYQIDFSKCNHFTLLIFIVFLKWCSGICEIYLNSDSPSKKNLENLNFQQPIWNPILSAHAVDIWRSCETEFLSEKNAIGQHFRLIETEIHSNALKLLKIELYIYSRECTMGISASEKRINKGKRHANKCHHCIKFSPRKIYNFD